MDDRRPRKRSRRSSLLLSLVAHVLGLILLGLVSLSTSGSLQPIVLQASSVDSRDQPLESVQLQATEATESIEKAQEVEAEVDVSLRANQTFEPNLSTESLINSGGLGESFSQDGMTSGLLSASEAGSASTVFCGVEEGGRHFVYLVDSSRSMGQAFESAKAELQRAIDSLNSDQRFYVIFFDESSSYMDLAGTGVDKSESVLATRENKRRVSEWAVGIQMDSGKAPYEPLEFALRLRPDAIFLLSDGQFPEGILRLLEEKNRVNNLFGEQRVRCAVHTIAYHSREGEPRMRQIAGQNSGQFRYVPRPGTR